MSMPEELSVPIQRMLRTVISSVMLVQCFTVYVYLATYIVLLYPVFLEERPALVLPWLLLAAIRKLLCELTSLALGLGTCVLLGPARPPCIRFLVMKIISITPGFYLWMLVFNYYHQLKMAAAFKTFSSLVLRTSDHDYGLEQAVRRRRTKSLFGEEQLRQKMFANFYGKSTTCNTESPVIRLNNDDQADDDQITEQGASPSDEPGTDLEIDNPISLTSNNRHPSDFGTYEDWFGSDVTAPRNSDRITEQFGLMMLRISVYLTNSPIDAIKLLSRTSPTSAGNQQNIECTAMPNDNSDTPPIIGSKKGAIASYIRDYPQIFMKKVGENKSGLLLELSLQRTEENQECTHSKVTQINEQAPYNNHDGIETNKYLDEKEEESNGKTQKSVSLPEHKNSQINSIIPENMYSKTKRMEISHTSSQGLSGLSSSKTLTIYNRVTPKNQNQSEIIKTSFIEKHMSHTQHNASVSPSVPVQSRTKKKDNIKSTKRDENSKKVHHEEKEKCISLSPTNSSQSLNSVIERMKNRTALATKYKKDSENKLYDGREKGNTDQSGSSNISKKSHMENNRKYRNS